MRVDDPGFIRDPNLQITFERRQAGPVNVIALMREMMLNRVQRTIPCMKLKLTLLLFSAVPMLAGEPTNTAANAINAFGVDLLRQAAGSSANVLLSPYSIQSALAMTFAGADGDTRVEMAKVLHYPPDDAEVHRSFAALRKALEETVHQSEEYARNMRGFATNDPITLTVANRLFGQSGYDFRSEFLSLVKDSYDAPFAPLDFINNPSAAANHINAWVENQTRERIRDVIPQNALNSLTRLVLVNAIYLKSPWAEPFEASATKPAPFHVNGGKPVEVPMMTQRHEREYGKGGGFSILKLPYGNYGLQFVIFLPDKVAGLAALEKDLTLDVLAGKVKWEARDVTLYLPKFKLEPPMLPLSGTLQTLGMRSAFDQPMGSANFDRIAPRRPDGYLRISEVFHKTFLNLDEKGTEAAAATAIRATYYGGSHEPPRPIDFRVDRPFLFAIQHQPSGACLFLGHVSDPR